MTIKSLILLTMYIKSSWVTENCDTSLIVDKVRMGVPFHELAVTGRGGHAHSVVEEVQVPVRVDEPMVV